MSIASAMLGGMDRLKVIHTQLGFRPGHGKKRVVVPLVREARTVFGSHLFYLMEQNRFSMEPLNADNHSEYAYWGPLTRVDGDMGPALVGDFSQITDPGVYQIYCAGEPGPSFVIRDDVWLRVVPDLLRYFQIQSCGRDVPGWHPACHLDDGYIPEEDRYLEAAGGWHDAGDFRKWVTSTALNAVSLLVCHRIWAGREETLGLAPGIFLREALQGVHYFLGVQDPETGLVYQNVGGGADSCHDNRDNRYTDNVPRSGDERRIHPGSVHTPGKCTALYALYAEALKGTDDELAGRCRTAALLSHKADHNRRRDDTESLQWRAWALLALWRGFGDEAHHDELIEVLGALLALQVTEYEGGQRTTRGYWRAEAGSPVSHHKHVGYDYLIWILGECIEALPNHPDAAKWTEAIARWVEDYALVFAGRNPWGLLPYAFYPEAPADKAHCHYRRLGDGMVYRYFLADNKFGVNARISISAAALGAAARVLQRPALMDDAYRLLEWILGNNPFQLSTMTGFGVLQPCALSFQMGNIPGGVTFGIHGDRDDEPAYWHPWSCSDEYYGYQSSQFLWAVLALQDLSH
jgi:hypothetical protein